MIRQLSVNFQKALCALEHWKLEKWSSGGAMRSIDLLLEKFFAYSIERAHDEPLSLKSNLRLQEILVL